MKILPKVNVIILPSKARILGTVCNVVKRLKISCLKKKDTEHLNTHAIVAIRNITRIMKKNMKDINKSVKVKTEKGKMYSLISN